MKLTLLRAPFPWFGGKSRVASQVWERFGEVRNYVEPFAGSLAVLLGRRSEPKIETVNDADAYLSNFWRAVSVDPDEVARWADWPVSEPDLHARHRWLVESARERVAQVCADPDFYDAKVAGWWVWGQCLWIGSGWCARPGWTGRVKAGRTARGINGAEWGKLPAIAGRDGGRGAYAKSRSTNPRAGDPIEGHRRRPHLGSDGEGDGITRVIRKRDPNWQQRPHLGSDGKGQGLVREGAPTKKLPQLGGESKGVNAKGIGAAGWAKRPVLQQGEGGRDVRRLSHQVPDLSGDSGAAGRGIHASGFLARSGGLQAYMRALSDRLRRVRVCCGDFERVLGPAVTTCIGLTGVLLDPPYDNDGRAICYTHDGPEVESERSVWWRAYRWAIEHGEDPLLRIALCGYEHPDATFPAGWAELAWKSSGGYGSSPRGKANAARERIWFSPGCLSATGQAAIDFAGAEATP